MRTAVDSHARTGRDLIRHDHKSSKALSISSCRGLDSLAAILVLRLSSTNKMPSPYSRYLPGRRSKMQHKILAVVSIELKWVLDVGKL